MKQMTEHTFLTVIITAYNIEKYICNCIQSIQEQTFTDFECIIVDDGSADGTLGVIRHSIRNDARFRSVTIPHGGPQKLACMFTLAEKSSQREKEKYRKYDYNKCFDLAFGMLRSSKDRLSETEYAEELAYLESRFVPSVQEAPYRFCLEHSWMSREKRTSDFMEQIRAFQNSQAMNSLFAILDEAAQKTGDISRRFECEDDYAFLCQFGTRKGERQQSLNTPAALRIEDLLCEKKEQLYHALYDLGFIANNKTCFESYDYILILGGANDANRLRTKKAMEIADELTAREKKPRLIAGVSTYRRLAEAEHKGRADRMHGIS